MKNLSFIRKNYIIILLFLCILSKTGSATPLSVLTNAGAIEFANDDGYVTSSGYDNPGYGWQSFDAEHLFYKFQNNILTIALQTGFDLKTGKVKWGDFYYYAGDLALSFDGNNANYEYAADFGLLTKDYANSDYVGGNKSLGVDTAGIYKVTNWNNDVYGPYGASRPFAMETGTLLGALDSASNLTGSGNTGYSTSGIYSLGGYSFFRAVSFPVYLISEITPGDPIQLSAHWTMSCGNDAINGEASIPNPIPEPGTMFLLGGFSAGLLGFSGFWRKRFKLF